MSLHTKRHMVQSLYILILMSMDVFLQNLRKLLIEFHILLEKNAKYKYMRKSTLIQMMICL